MEFVPQLLTSLWSLKNKYDQHGDNKNEIARVQKFIEDYEERIPQLLVGFKQHGVSGTIMDDLKKLRVVIMEATMKLNGWAADRSFFRVLSSAQRMQELDRLEAQVMASTQKAVGFITLAMVMQLSGGHKEILAGVNQILERLPEPRSRPAQAQPVQPTLSVTPQFEERLKIGIKSINSATGALSTDQVVTDTRMTDDEPFNFLRPNKSKVVTPPRMTKEEFFNSLGAEKSKVVTATRMTDDEPFNFLRPNKSKVVTPPRMTKEEFLKL